DGTEQILTGVMGNKGPKSKYVPASLPDAGVCIRWGCTASVPPGLKIINKVEAIHKVANKAAFRKLTADKGLAPKTTLNYLDMGDIQYPVVVRPGTHAQGKHVYEIGRAPCRGREES